MSTPKATPTQANQRIIMLDVLRGFALLGILIMNIRGFAMPAAAYDNPTLWGDFTGANRLVWLFGQLFADHKMMNLFSMLFGAGIVLFTERLEARNGKPVQIHYRRTFWLLVIGLAHAYLLWYGDILVTYALTALVIVWFRKRQARTLLVLGLVFLSMAALFMAGTAASIDFMPPAQAEELREMWEPTQTYLQSEAEALRGGWLDQMAARVAGSAEMQTIAFATWGFWRSGGLMLLGMALYKWGILSGRRTRTFYRNLMLIGLGVGLILVGVGVARQLADGFTFASSRFSMTYQFNYWGSVLVSLGYIGAIGLITQTGIWQNLQDRLAAVGRMALTNYLLHTIIATTIFYGHGFGLFGEVSHVGQIGVVLAIWIFQLIISPIWLSRFRFGPFEWAWRTLTYWKPQALRLKQPTTA